MKTDLVTEAQTQTTPSAPLPPIQQVPTPPAGQVPTPPVEQVPTPPAGQVPIQPFALKAADNSLGTSSLALGIIAVLLDVGSWFFYWPLAIFGLMLGVTGLSQGIKNQARLRRGEAANSGVTSAGIVLNSIALAASVVALLIMVIAAFI